MQKFLVVENIPDVCESIINRMQQFAEWTALDYSTDVKDATEKISKHRPALIFLDWHLNGGSAYEILQQIDQLPGYKPYIIFNTAHQDRYPDIPQEVHNNYKVDKYLVKPIWEDLTRNLSQYVAEAVCKLSVQEPTVPRWFTLASGRKVALDLKELACIRQSPHYNRCRDFLFASGKQATGVRITWKQCYELMTQSNLDFFIAKDRYLVVIKTFVAQFNRPYFQVKGVPERLEVVRDNLTAFDRWLTAS